MIKKAKSTLQSLVASHDNCKRSEGDLSHQYCQSPSNDTHHRQNFTLDVEELCILSMGNIKFQGDLTDKYSY